MHDDTPTTITWRDITGLTPAQRAVLASDEQHGFDPDTLLFMARDCAELASAQRRDKFLDRLALLVAVLAVAAVMAGMFLFGVPPFAHADDTQDAKFIAELASHNLVAGQGVPQVTFEAAQINGAHMMCSELGDGMSRGEILAQATRENPGPTARQMVTIVLNAAIDVYCPQYKGQ
jgi:hypothetical protein